MNGNEIQLSPAERFVRAHIQHYDEKKYWGRQEKVVAAPQGGSVSKLINIWRLLYIKRCDAYNNASTGTHLGIGARFKAPPRLPHGLYGIVISHNAVIGSGCTIYHQVTIGEGRHGAPGRS